MKVEGLPEALTRVKLRGHRTHALLRWARRGKAESTFAFSSSHRRFPCVSPSRWLVARAQKSDAHATVAGNSFYRTPISPLHPGRWPLYPTPGYLTEKVGVSDADWPRHAGKRI